MDIVLLYNAKHGLLLKDVNASQLLRILLAILCWDIPKYFFQ